MLAIQSRDLNVTLASCFPNVKCISSASFCLPRLIYNHQHEGHFCKTFVLSSKTATRLSIARQKRDIRWVSAGPLVFGGTTPKIGAASWWIVKYESKNQSKPLPCCLVKLSNRDIVAFLCCLRMLPIRAFCIFQGTSCRAVRLSKHHRRDSHC